MTGWQNILTVLVMPLYIIALFTAISHIDWFMWDK